MADSDTSGVGDNSIIKFYCSNCNQKIRVPKIHSGKKARCPKCKSMLIIPNHSQGILSDNNKNNLNEPLTKKIDLEFVSKDYPEGYKVSDSAAGHNFNAREDYQAQKKINKLLEETQKPPKKRKLPWFIDIFLYPLNIPGLTMLAIIILIPFIIRVFVWLLGPFGFFLAVPGIIINAVIATYFFWYFVESLRDSANDGLRAPETFASTPGLGEMFWELFKTLGSLAFFIAPAVVYYMNTRVCDRVFWLLSGYAVFFFPMGLLAVVMFDSFSGLNPIVLVGSVLSTFFQYIGLVLLFSAVLYIAWVGMSTLPLWRIILKFIFCYLLLIAAHLLGRFYWRYKEKLNWDV
ncbi:MAG: hypothetical protein ACYSSI_13600 [Planctomycetota bacterium]|jgi:DNA-directed RNA polymerase subunit RPC12/RpoP